MAEIENEWGEVGSTKDIIGKKKLTFDWIKYQINIYHFSFIQPQFLCFQFFILRTLHRTIRFQYPARIFVSFCMFFAKEETYVSSETANDRPWTPEVDQNVNFLFRRTNFPHFLAIVLFGCAIMKQHLDKYTLFVLSIYPYNFLICKNETWYITYHKRYYFSTFT